MPGLELPWTLLPGACAQALLTRHLFADVVLLPLCFDTLVGTTAPKAKEGMFFACGRNVFKGRSRYYWEETWVSERLGKLISWRCETGSRFVSFTTHFPCSGTIWGSSATRKKKKKKNIETTAFKKSTPCCQHTHICTHTHTYTHKHIYICCSVTIWSNFPLLKVNIWSKCSSYFFLFLS